MSLSVNQKEKVHIDETAEFETETNQISSSTSNNNEDKKRKITDTINKFQQVIEENQYQNETKKIKISNDQTPLKTNEHIKSNERSLPFNLVLQLAKTQYDPWTRPLKTTSEANIEELSPSQQFLWNCKKNVATSIYTILCESFIHWDSKAKTLLITCKPDFESLPFDKVKEQCISAPIIPETLIEEIPKDELTKQLRALKPHLPPTIQKVFAEILGENPISNDSNKLKIAKELFSYIGEHFTIDIKTFFECIVDLRKLYSNHDFDTAIGNYLTKGQSLEKLEEALSSAFVQEIKLALDHCPVEYKKDLIHTYKETQKLF